MLTWLSHHHVVAGFVVWLAVCLLLSLVVLGSYGLERLWARRRGHGYATRA